MKALITIVGVVCFFSFHSVGAEPGTTMIDVEGGDVYTLKASEPLFSSDTFKWKTVPDGFKGFKAVRSELNSGTPLVVDTKEPGYLYAVLWQWDYGLFGHGPSPLNDLNGWELVDEAGAEIADAPKPFSSAPLYRLAIGSGRHSVNLVEYAGRSQDPDVLTAAVRISLRRLIVQDISEGETELPVITLAPELEQMLHQSLQMAGNDGNQQGAGIEPGLAERLQQSLRETHQQQEMNGEPSVLLTSGLLRSTMARFARHATDGMRVLSYQEIPDDKQIRIVSSIGGQQNSGEQTAT